MLLILDDMDTSHCILLFLFAVFVYVLLIIFVSTKAARVESGIFGLYGLTRSSLLAHLILSITGSGAQLCDVYLAARYVSL